MTLSPSNTAAAERRHWNPFIWTSWLAALTLLAFLVQGYHPYAEDGGMYLARVLALLHPSLFTQNAGFVREPLRISLFAPLLAVLARSTHVPLAWILLLFDLSGLWLTLYAGLQLLRRCTTSQPAQLAGIALLGAWSTMPVAATSLMLMDPYVTARTFSTPFTLLAVAFSLDRSSLGRSALCLLAAFAFHPLMAVYAAGLIVAMHLSRQPAQLKILATLAVVVLMLTAIVQACAKPDAPAAVAADITRYYWFLSQWHWYELLGLAGPLAVLTLLIRSRHLGLRKAAGDLCRASIAYGLFGVAIALLFAHQDYRSHIIARFQPLRVFCMVYTILPLLLGAGLQLFCQRQASQSQARTVRRAWQAIPVIVVIGSSIAMFAAQRSSFPSSGQIELPWRDAANPNPWVQAFRWIRASTPPDALFALDARYINTRGEDAQVFRAIAQRNVLPDYSKDGGEASQMPGLAEAWQKASAAQKDLSALPDAVRDARLQPFAVSWMVLHSTAATLHPCPYDNGTVKVCRLAP